ncbi:MAG: hypothetical protein HC927_03085 [Deltaproteobacteria bacterium]|nr:hypothetical protein [Deltaproteobacteria bacterium]
MLPLLSVAVIACGDNPGEGNGDEIGESSSSSSSDTNEGEGESGESVGTTDEGDGDSTTAETDSTGDGDPSDEGPQTKFDLGTTPDSGHFECNGGGDDFEFSFLWAANSDQGTISKIDTKTVTEVGRFMTRSDFNGSPSRTSVSLSGHVAVANRNGGVTKIYADAQFCKESNGMPGIQTSNNNQALPWDQEECRAWYTPFNYVSQRPVAWGPGKLNQGTCQYEDEELWTSGNNQGATIDIILLDGDDGTVKEMIQVPTDAGPQSLNQDYYGIYGGAVDGEGNFWGSQLGSGGKLIKVDRADMSWKIYQQPAGPHWYGMTSSRRHGLGLQRYGRPL